MPHPENGWGTEEQGKTEEQRDRSRFCSLFLWLCSVPLYPSMFGFADLYQLPRIPAPARQARTYAGSTCRQAARTGSGSVWASVSRAPIIS